MEMSDAPRLVPADELTKRTTHSTLFERVKSPALKALLQEAVQRMNGFGEDAEPKYQRALAAVREAGEDAIEALGREFAALDDEYVNRWGVVQLLHDLQDPRALSLLDRIVSSPMPPESSPDPHSSTAGREGRPHHSGRSHWAPRRGRQHRGTRCAPQVRTSLCTVREDRRRTGISRAGKSRRSQGASPSHGEIRSLDGRRPPCASARASSHRGTSVPPREVAAGTGHRTETGVSRCWPPTEISASL